MERKKGANAREQFKTAEQNFEQLREQKRRQLAEGMSENMERIGVFLPLMLSDEANLRARGSQLDPQKLQESYFGGFSLERIGKLRIGVNVFKIGLCPYDQAEIEAMHGFKKLVKACASEAIDMDLRVTYDRGWAQTTIEIALDRPFNHNGPYKEMTAPAKRPAPAAPRKP